MLSQSRGHLSTLTWVLGTMSADSSSTFSEGEMLVFVDQPQKMDSDTLYPDGNTLGGHLYPGGSTLGGHLYPGGNSVL